MIVAPFIDKIITKELEAIKYQETKVQVEKSAYF